MAVADLQSAARTRLRRAKKSHQCTERSYHEIKVGDYYLNVVAAPWHEMADGKKWWIIKACLRCANEFGFHNSDTRKKLEEFTPAPSPENTP